MVTIILCDMFTNLESLTFNIYILHNRVMCIIESLTNVFVLTPFVPTNDNTI